MVIFAIIVKDYKNKNSLCCILFFCEGTTTTNEININLSHCTKLYDWFDTLKKMYMYLYRILNKFLKYIIIYVDKEHVLWLNKGQ